MAILKHKIAYGDKIQINGPCVVRFPKKRLVEIEAERSVEVRITPSGPTKRLTQGRKRG